LQTVSSRLGATIKKEKTWFVSKLETDLKGIGPRGMAKVKLEDVARNANFSPATVSRILNHPERVRPEVRGKVARSIAKLSYTRDSVGRALKSARTLTVSAIVPTLGVGIFAARVEALQNRLSRHGYMPAAEIGRSAADYLLCAFTGSTTQCAVLPYRLIIRGSTDVPPKTNTVSN
jgi:DNA-binding LacI/PurR family transcriptional regulator